MRRIYEPRRDLKLHTIFRALKQRALAWALGPSATEPSLVSIFPQLFSDVGRLY